MQDRFGKPNTDTRTSSTSSSSIPEFPNVGQFRSLTEDYRDNLPDVSQEILESYVIHRQGKDRSAVGDFKAIQKGQKMAEENVAGVSLCSKNNMLYISACVEASMKNVYYSAKLILNHTGDIEYSFCDCPSGEGPHGTCKHICSVYVVLVTLKVIYIVILSEFSDLDFLQFK